MVCEEISSNEKFVFLFGSAHSDKPEQLELIKELIETFNPDIVLVEGNFDKAVFSFEEDAIKYGREMGYISFLCKKKGINVGSNDPPFEYDKRFVEEKYDSNVKELYFSLRQFSPRTTDEEKEKIRILLREILNEDFDETKNYSEYFNPTLSVNQLNEITRELNDFRDSYMIKKIKNLLEENKRVFVIKGNYHLKTNKEKIREVVNGN